MRIVLLGAPGSGKGTQSKLLIEKYKIPQISTGDLLRAAVAAGSDLGRKAKSAMDAGLLVSDDVVLGMIQERLSKPDARAGFILDGFPRNIPQAQALDAMLARLSQPLQLALLVDVDTEVLMKRLTGRRTCSNAMCGAIYNIYFSAPKSPGKCDKCGANLAHRSDDNENTVRSRLQVYGQQTAPLVSYYKAQGKLRTVRGTGSVNEIFKNVTDIIEVQMRPLAAAMSAAQLPPPRMHRPNLPSRRRSLAAVKSGGQACRQTRSKTRGQEKARAEEEACTEEKPAPKPKKKAVKKRPRRKPRSQPRKRRHRKRRRKSSIYAVTLRPGKPGLFICKAVVGWVERSATHH